MERYDHKAIEKKWQDHWEAEGLYRAVDDDDRPTYYVLDMFPYPSGAGLHVGHPEGYTATDIVARRMRMAGYNVLHPMGWDAFGLPAENYAIKTQIHPDQSTRQNIENFRRQIKMLGFSYDWDREVSTSAPDYYKWTQWWFAFLYRQGLAYRRHAPVNWCMQCHTVLANEQVHDGICYCGRDGRVEQKGMEQWFFRITDFIEDTEHNGRVTRGLLSGLDTIDWPESTKAAQRNWIGRSEGAEVDFRLDDGTVLTVFTTRPDTLFGATFMVLAPEHPAVAGLTSPDQQAAVDAYVSQAKAKTELERQSEKDKTGAFTGGYAVNPVNGDRVPVWIADYVLMGYGTGAIMAVPGHDERDFAFARTFGLEIRRVVAPTADAADAPLDEAFAEPGVAVHSGPLDGLATDRAKQRMIEILEAEGTGRRKITYKLRDWLISRQRYWGAPIPVIYDADGHPELVPDDQLPVLLPTDVDFMPGSGSPLVRSESFNDLPEGQRREADTMDTFVCSSWYFFRYCDPKNDTAFADPAKLKKWAPVDLYVGGAEHTVLHLLYARFFTKAAHRAGLIDFDEPFLKLRHQGMILAEDGQKMSKSRGNVVNPDDVVDQYGADAMRLYEMFMGPFADSKPWATTGIEGIHRFLQRLWRLFAKPMDGAMDKDFRHLLHKTIKKIEEDTDNFRFNTAVSQMMIFVNEAGNRESLPRDGMADFLRLIAPYVPHMAEELWHRLGQADSVHREPWPKWDPEAVVEDVIQLVVQVNGKLRDQIAVARNIAKDEAIAAAKASEKAAKWIEGKTIVKEVFVPGKLVNIVVKG